MLGQTPVARAEAAARASINPQVRTAVRRGLIVYFMMVLLEGVFRKWLLPGLNVYIYVAKDAVLAFVCLRTLLALNRISPPLWLKRSSIGGLFTAFAVYSFAEGFNPQLPNVLLGLWGIRTYVLPMSLAYLVPIGFPNPRENERLFRKYLLLGIPIAVLCMVQYRLPASHMLNKYANSESATDVARIGDAVRVTGPFSYITGVTSYLAFAIAGLLGVLVANRWSTRGNKLIWLTLFLSIAVIPMTGARSMVLYLLLYLGIVAILSPMLKQGHGAPSRMLIAGICVALLSAGLFGEAIDRIAERARTSSDTTSRFYKLTLQPLDFLDSAGFFGFGAAATHQAAPVLVPRGASYYWLPVRGFEDESGRVMLEMGGVGFILYMALKLGVCIATLKYIRRYGHAVPLAVPIACLLTAASCTVSGMLFNSVGSSFFWGIFGLFLAQADATVERTPIKR